MKTFAFTLVLGLSALPLFVASAASEPTAEPQPATNEATPAFELAHKSSFAMEENSRNPFWPIGWKPSAKLSTNTNDSAGPDVLPSFFVVSSITVDAGGNFAIINGRTMTEGQVFGLQKGTQTYQITVKEIQDGQVILLRHDQEIAVPLRRR